MKAAFNERAYADVLRNKIRVDRLVSHASAVGSPLLPASPRNSQSGPPSGGTQIVLPVAGAISLDDISSGKVSAPARQALVFDGSQEYYNDEVFIFWKPPSILSKWTPCEFSVHGIHYVCDEQSMMAEKARIFGDDAADAKIMGTSDPREHKSLGRKVRGFDHALWELRREDVVFSLLNTKFAQNADARERLLATDFAAGASAYVAGPSTPGAPYFLRPNPLVEKKVDAMLDQYLAAGLIQHSQSPWASPLVALPKMEGNLCLTVNCKKLNKLCSLGQQPQPRVDHIIDSLHKGKVFSIFDLNSTFHQITVEEDTVQLTAFCTPTQLFEWLRMPRGSSVALSWFTMVINEVVTGLDHVLAYLDDVIVFDADPVHHVANIRLFLERLRKYNLTFLISRVASALRRLFIQATPLPCGC
ncbi:unnamed protein product [Ectocarpus sp. CCAP 1310/34]|nr:unnamed protein product [Ectocarpus sp. CCAP 1310/34]